MTDLDFDELDREVSKLVQADTTPDAAIPPQKLEQSLEKSENKDASLIEQTSNTTARPRGRFMDVMHPSSDMKSDSTPLQSDQLTSTVDRKSIEPVANEEKTKETLEESIPETSPAPFHTDMPDPIDFHESQNTKDTSGAEADEIDEPLSNNPPLPSNDKLEGLFKDSEVEKRPLGQFSQKEQPTVTINTVDGEKVDKTTIIEDKDSSDDDTAAPQDNEPIDLPPELEKDLVAIEAGESPDDIPSIAEEGNKKTEIEEAKEKPGSKTEDKDNKDLSSTAALLASGSIPQQYKIALKEKVSREGDHALFDSSHYETAPSKATTKKKSGHKALLQWIFIVIGLLLLGSTIGAALFVFVSNQ